MTRGGGAPFKTERVESGAPPRRRWWEDGVIVVHAKYGKIEIEVRGSSESRFGGKEEGVGAVKFEG